MQHKGAILIEPEEIDIPFYLRRGALDKYCEKYRILNIGPFRYRLK